MASYNIYTVFHVPGCFKFKFTFYNVFSFKLVLPDIDITLKWFLQSLLATEHAKFGLVINWVKFSYVV